MAGGQQVLCEYQLLKSEPRHMPIYYAHGTAHPGT